MRIQIVTIMCLALVGCSTPSRRPQAQESVSHASELARTDDVSFTETMEIFELLEIEPVDLSRFTAAVEAGTDVNTRHPNGMTPLMYASARVSEPMIIERMIRLGAELESRSDLGSTALMISASLNTNAEVHRALLDAGADVNAQDDAGLTALAIASGDNANPEVIRLLIDAGSDIESKDRIGMTPLFYAVANNPDPGITSMLIQANAMVDIALPNGLTPLMMAAARASEPSTIKLLLGAGADIRRTDAMGRSGMTYLLQNQSLSESQMVDIIETSLSSADGSRGSENQVEDARKTDDPASSR